MNTRNTLDGNVSGPMAQWGRVVDDVRFGDLGVATPVPRQLPAHTSHFVGRRREIAELNGLIEMADTSTVVISAINGTAGIGKTALALRWALNVRERFPDGQLYVDLRGYDRHTSIEPTQALHGFLLALGITPEAIPLDPEARAALYRTLLADRRMLVLLDNAKDSDHVRPLLPGHSSCVALITSRSSLDSLVAREGAQRLTLDLLDQDDAVSLIAQRIGVNRIKQEAVSAALLTDQCARLPLALSIAAARIAALPNLRLEQLTAELDDENERLNALNVGDADLDLRTVFSWSYQGLSSLARNMFQLLSVHPGPEIGLPAAISLANFASSTARKALRELVRAHLLDQHVPSRFRFHDLLRVYAVEQAAQSGGISRSSAIRRVLDHYVYTGWEAERRLYPYQLAPRLGELPDGVQPEVVASYTEAMEWFTRERNVLISAARTASTSELHWHAVHIPWILVTYFDRQGYWHDYVSTLESAAKSANRMDDISAQAMCSRYLGRAYMLLERYAEALSAFERALVLFGQLGHIEGVARSHRGLSLMYLAQRDYDSAANHARKALELFRRVQHHSGEARALHCLGWSVARLGQFEEAVQHFTAALVVIDSLGYFDDQGRASAIDGLGFTFHHLGQYELAIEHYKEALALWRKLSNRYFAADTLRRLGEAYRDNGDIALARQVLKQSLAIIEPLQVRDTDAVRRLIASLE